MTITDDTLTKAKRIRIELSATVDQQVRDLTTAWATAWDELIREWDAAMNDLVGASVDGRWPTRLQVYRVNRVIAALDRTRERLEGLTRYTGVRVVGDIDQVVFAAARAQADLYASQMPPDVQITAQFDRVSPDALDQVVTRVAGQVTSLARPLTDRAMAAINATLIRGVAVGDNPRKVARDMLRRVEGDFNGGLTRALNIARTEMLDAHREAQRLQDIANRDVLSGWKWLTTFDSRTCPSCLAQNGTLHPVEESGPDDHQQGRCARVPVTKTWRELGFDIDEPEPYFPDAQAWFDGLPAKDQTAIMGPTRRDLYAAGKVDWADLSTRRTTTGWRDSYVPTPVRDLLAKATA